MGRGSGKARCIGAQRIEDTNQSILEVEETLAVNPIEKKNWEEDIAKIDEETKACEAESAKVELEINEKEKRLDEIRAQNQELAERVEALKDQRNDLQEKDSELAEQVTEKENEAKELNDKLRIPHLKGWHYTEEKGWLLDGCRILSDDVFEPRGSMVGIFARFLLPVEVLQSLHRGMAGMGIEVGSRNLHGSVYLSNLI